MSGKCWQNLNEISNELRNGLHFSDTDGPGCIVCSINLYTSCGAPSANKLNKAKNIKSDENKKTKQRKKCKARKIATIRLSSIYYDT